MAPLKAIGEGYGRMATDSLHAVLNKFGCHVSYETVLESPTLNRDDFYEASFKPKISKLG
ncbi:hypothetical protein MFLAVUS_001535 [Mucor flavus]|uniref:Uncharacterized protein n=1 Tax=Mucor flavus TaxID=439312 RepID=A0ABP9YMS5_9FUNG